METKETVTPVTPVPLKRFWVSWWSKDNHKLTPPFQHWASKPDSEEKITFHAVIDAEHKDALWTALKIYWPSLEIRSATEVAAKFKPVARFHGFRNHTSLVKN